ncbi:uncharacterized protein LOC133326830 [Musca vetustissima]|uniref:uncharacterized protein LOC133326830 n=1 Tax=Musca vetustissima TaxID=27455 RepID=UPI002AB744A0|nr:uncharacterized protein LOC133326830 [Musca vetustissima]
MENISNQEDGFNLLKDESAPSEEADKKVKFLDYSNIKIKNQQHIVPIGLLIVLATIYLGMSGIQSCFVNCSENHQLLLKSAQNLIYNNNNDDIKDPQVILERLLEYKDICRDLEIFTKELNKTTNAKTQEQTDDVKNEIVLENSGSGSGGGSGANGATDDGSGDECTTTTSSTKSYSKKNKKPKSKYSIKFPTNAKNGFHKYNKSTTKAKNGKHDKKDLNINKKNSSAEPIIYLFALVFIYLLIKAASDINQHYKSENKKDKNFMRRCSLQSYAQAHRDRRSSKANNLFTKINSKNNNNIRIGNENKTTTHIGIFATFHQC